MRLPQRYRLLPQNSGDTMSWPTDNVEKKALFSVILPLCEAEAWTKVRINVNILFYSDVLF